MVSSSPVPPYPLLRVCFGSYTVNTLDEAASVGWMAAERPRGSAARRPPAQMDPMELAGWEGLWGGVLCVFLVLPLFQTIPGARE